uniref:Tissue factor n=1 Tax=Meleagris gallopavo TaxID=9103 RepID=A0A803XUK4_MELGA
ASQRHREGAARFASLVARSELIGAAEEATFRKQRGYAVNITWSSINFKTILKWQPKPSVTWRETSDTRKKCIMTTETECDVTDALRNVKETYTAHILSVKSLVEDNFEEPLFASSEKFTPYNQTIIGKPEIQHYTQEDSKLNVVFRDPLTPYMFSNGSFQSVRDIFKHDLEYKLYYWKDQSSGKKDATTKSHMFDISVDNKNNYCFYVQGIIPSRRENRNGQESMVLCTTIERTILDGMYLVKSVVLPSAFQQKDTSILNVFYNSIKCDT